MVKKLYINYDRDWSWDFHSSDDFFGCCGCRVIGTFDCDKETILDSLQDMWSDQYSTKDIMYLPTNKQFIARHINELSKAVSREIEPNKISFIVLTEHQQWQKPALIKSRFRLVSDGKVRNNGNGNKLFVYIYDPVTKIKGKTLKKRRF